MGINNKITIVPDGYSGLGYATAKSLMSKGAKVAIFDLNDTQGQGASVVEDFGDDALFCRVDVRDSESVESAVSKVVERWGAVHICVNCAGVAPAKRLLDKDGKEMPLDAFQSVIDINLVGTFNVARVAASAMSRNKQLGEVSSHTKESHE